MVKTINIPPFVILSSVKRITKQILVIAKLNETKYLVLRSCVYDMTFSNTAQKMKFSIKDFFSKYDQIRRKMRIWSHLLKKSLMENFILCAVQQTIICSRLATEAQ